MIVSWHNYALFTVLLPLLTATVGSETIEDYICQNKFTGCKLDYKERACLEGEATGCFNPFPYKDVNECMKDFTGRGNICDRNPCRHGGICAPITTADHKRTFKCECVSTGYFGRRCHRKCPKDLSGEKMRHLSCLQI